MLRWLNTWGMWPEDKVSQSNLSLQSESLSLWNASFCHKEMEIYLRDFLWERNKIEDSDSYACILLIRIYEKQSEAIMLPWQIIRACNSVESNAKPCSDESAGLVCLGKGTEWLSASVRGVPVLSLLPDSIRTTICSIQPPSPHLSSTSGDQFLYAIRLFPVNNLNQFFKKERKKDFHRT